MSGEKHSFGADYVWTRAGVEKFQARIKELEADLLEHIRLYDGAMTWAKAEQNKRREAEEKLVSERSTVAMQADLLAKNNSPSKPAAEIVQSLKDALSDFMAGDLKVRLENRTSFHITYEIHTEDGQLVITSREVTDRAFATCP